MPKKRTIVLMATTIALTVLVVGGVALAANIDCVEGLRCNGTPDNDRMEGTAGFDQMAGEGGDDVMYGRGSNDLMIGGEGNDKIDGGTGDDAIFGEAGSDVMIGRSGADFVDAESLESLSGGPDTIRTGADDDQILAQNLKRDTINCGTGIDTADVDDGLDKVSNNCEFVNPF